jgi:hypothetical protein
MENTTTALTTKPEHSAFSVQGFDHAQRLCKMFASSDMVPKAYQNRIDNCMVALEIANRSGTSPLAVMQNLHIIQGKPSWSSTYVIALINSSGRLKERLKFRSSGTGDDYGYEAYGIEKTDGKELVGPKITWKMVKEEGWLSKNGSKWKTMPELMFQYRAAAFFGRLHTPELMLGMQSVEEVIDIQPEIISQERPDNKAEEAKRMVELIKSADTVEDLKELEPHLQPEQLDLFDHRMLELKEKKNG